MKDFFDDSFGGCICNFSLEDGAFTGKHSEKCARIRAWAAERVMCERDACARIAEIVGSPKAADQIRERRPDEIEWSVWKLKHRPWMVRDL